MRITKCIASKQGLFDNRTLELGKKLNFIYGKNGSGKSVLSCAMADMFRVRPFTGRPLWENLYVEIHLSNENGSFKIMRSGNRHCSVVDTETGNELLRSTPESAIAPKDIEQPGDTPPPHGIFNTPLPDSTPIDVILTGSPADSDERVSLDYAAIQDILLNDASGFHRLYKDIVRSLGDGTFGRANRSAFIDKTVSMEGELRELNKKIQLIDMETGRTGKLLKEKLEIENDIARMKEELHELRDETAAARRIIDDMHSLRETGQAINALASEIRDAEHAIADTADREKALVAGFPQFHGFNDTTRQNMKKIQEAYREIRDINAAIDKELYAKKIRKHKVDAAAAASGAFCLIAACTVSTKKAAMLPPGTAVYALMAIFAFYGIGLLAAYLSLSLMARSKAFHHLTAAKDAAETRLRNILSENKVSLFDYRIESLYEFLLQYFEDYGEYTEKQLELHIAQNTLKSAQDIRDLKQRLESLTDQNEARKKSIIDDMRALKKYPPSGFDIDEMQHRVAEMEDAAAALETRINEKNRLLEQVAEDIAQSPSRETELDALNALTRAAESRYRRLISHKDAMLFLCGIFEESIAARERHQLQRLVSSVKDSFNFITNRQYITTVDDDLVKSVITGREDCGVLNTALFHILRLCLKIALSDFLAEDDVHVPLIIDDPFLFMDDRRAANLKELLKTTSEKRQVIVFTQNAQYLDQEERFEL